MIRVWSLEYVRFWVVRTLVRRNLLVFLFAGSPLYTLYLRALGAKVGRGVTILSLNVPACTDLLTDRLRHRRAQGRLLQLLPRRRGDHPDRPRLPWARTWFIGEVTVLDIEHLDGRRSPARTLLGPPGRAGGARRRVLARDPRPAGRGRLPDRRPPSPAGSVDGVPTSLLQLVTSSPSTCPWGSAGAIVAFRKVPALRPSTPRPSSSSGWAFLRDRRWRVPRCCCTSVPCSSDSSSRSACRGCSTLFVKPDTTYPLYGVHYSLHRDDRADDEHTSS